MSITDDLSIRWILRAEKGRRAPFHLVFVPWAGSGTAAYHGWPGRLPADVEGCVLRLPGRESRRREPLATALPELAAAAAAALAELPGPVGLFGHSSGGLIAFEVARALRRDHGREPVLLAISAQPAPHLPARYEPIRELPDEQFLNALDERCHSVPPELRRDPEMRAMYIPVMRADVTLEETYRYRPDAPLGCPIAAYGGQADTESREPDLAAWAEHTAAGFRLHILPGGHFFFQEQQDVMLAGLADQLRAAHRS